MRRGSACVVHAAAAVASRPASALRMPALPFVKIADQEDMKLALMLNVVDPTVGGVLIMGDRGTGKSVAVRPQQQGKAVVRGAQLSAAPVQCSWQTGSLFLRLCSAQGEGPVCLQPVSTGRAGSALATSKQRSRRGACLVLPDLVWGVPSAASAAICTDLAGGQCARVRARLRAWRRAVRASGDLFVLSPSS